MIARVAEKQVVQAIVDRLVADYQPERIILFGSYAYGQPEPDSDIDWLVVKETHDQPIDRHMCVREIVYQPSRRVPISPLVITPADLNQRLVSGDDFLREVIERGEVLYERGESIGPE